MGVQLWIPEVGGAVDPGSDAHDLVMSLYGGMSKGERNRIKIRVRSAMAAQAALEGRYLGGRPPYGYRLTDAGPHPNPGKAADGKRLHKLEPDPLTAPIVQRIYAEYLAGSGIHAIADRLTRDGVLSPSASDRKRNPHRSGTAWTKGAVRVILMNPRYTGKQVWNKQRKAEVLIDVDDVALGHDTKMRWNPGQDWIYSATQAHEAIIEDEVFQDVQKRMAAGAKRPDVIIKPRAGKRVYPLSGMLFCGLCGRRMEGSFNNDRKHYRCVYSAEYAKTNHIEHPRSLYLREDKILELVDAWIGRAFAPRNLRTTLDAMVAAQHDDTDQHRITTAREKIASCDSKLAKYRAALEAGTDPALVQQWITQVQAERAVAEAEARQLSGRRTMTADEIRTIVEALSDIAAILRTAEPGDKAEVYRQLGLNLQYEPGLRKIKAEASPMDHVVVCVRGGT